MDIRAFVSGSDGKGTSRARRRLHKNPGYVFISKSFGIKSFFFFAL
jgi:hypothetical protein